MEHYRKFCIEQFGDQFKHMPSSGGDDDGRKHWVMYSDTLKNYKNTLCLDPPADIWEPVEMRFHSQNFTFRNMNLYRLAVIYSYKAIMPLQFQNT